MVGISLLTLVPGLFGGTETYSRELIRALARVGTLDYRVYTSSLAPDAADGLPGATVASYPASRTTGGRLLAMGRSTASRRVRRELELGSLDAIHFPLSIMIPPVRRPPAVTTVHDVLDKIHPEVFSRAERGYRKIVYGWTARLSRLIIVPSEHSKEVLVERAGFDPGRIRVIPLGVSTERFSPGDGEREPFLLYPADGWPHKNHPRLLEAFALVRRTRPELRLVLTGARIERFASDAVEARGYVTQEELADLYRRASALVFPSLHETFGLPPLEAMASGCPVAVSKAGSLPEVCGDAARYFDPLSTGEIAEAISDVLEHPEGLVAKGYERVGMRGRNQTASTNELRLPRAWCHVGGEETPLSESRSRSASTIISTSSRKDAPGCQPSCRARLRRVADEVVDLGRTHELLVLDDMPLGVEPDAVERDLHELAHGVLFAGGDHEVRRLVLLQHQPHRLDVVACEAPVALRPRGCRAAAPRRGRA